MVEIGEYQLSCFNSLPDSPSDQLHAARSELARHIPFTDVSNSYSPNREHKNRSVSFDTYGSLKCTYITENL